MEVPWIVAILILIWATLDLVSAQLRTKIGYSVADDRMSGYVVGNIISDARLHDVYDQPTLGSLRFSFLDSSAQHVDLFNIGPASGVLSTSQTLDREQVCAFLEKCELAVAVQVNPPYFHVIRVTVTIEDINDHSPVFAEAAISRSLSESAPIGSRLPLPTATDRDSPRNGVDTYYLKYFSQYFDIQVSNVSNGAKQPFLVTKRALDRESQELHNVVVVARDAGTPHRTGSLTVDVTLLDVNDHSPAFTNQTYTASVPENTPVGTTILRISALDPDSGVNGQVTYGLISPPGQLQGHGQLLSINATTGALTLSRSLDREQDGATVSLTATAKDGDPNSFPSSVSVTVHILDINDNSPTIRIPTLSQGKEVAIAERQDPGSFVVYVRVTDPDDGDNGRVGCVLSDGAFNLVSLFDAEYKIVTNSALDREFQSYYNLALICSDRGSPPRSASVQIPVKVLDLNDNSPSFSRIVYYFNITENNAEGAQVGRVRSYDRDEGPNALMTYIVAQNAQSKFRIDDTGSLRASVPLNRESEGKLIFRIFVVDQGTPQLTGTATVELDILDVDDNDPQFQQEEYTFGIFENQPSGTEVGHVSAFDLDSDAYNKFVLEIDVENSTNGTSSSFRIDPETGWLYSTSVLDREAQEMYEITVLAKSQEAVRSTSSTQVFVYVADINDNPPIVDYPTPYNNSIFVSNIIPVDTVLTRVLAFDADSGTNSRLSFSIKSGNTKLRFFMDKYTGVITVNTSLEDIQYETFTLAIEVRDHGDPPKTISTILYIVVNESLPYPPESGTILQHRNLNIAIVIACVTGMLMVVLAVAIAVIMRQQRGYSRNYKNIRRNSPCTTPSLGTAAATTVVISERKDDTYLVEKPGSNMQTLLPGGRPLPAGYAEDCEKGPTMSLSSQGSRRSSRQPETAGESGLGAGLTDAYPSGHSCQMPINKSQAQPGDLCVPEQDSLSGGSDVTDSGRGSSEEIGGRHHYVTSSHKSVPQAQQKLPHKHVQMKLPSETEPYRSFGSFGKRPTVNSPQAPVIPPRQPLFPHQREPSPTRMSHSSKARTPIYQDKNMVSVPSDDIRLTFVHGKANRKCTKCDGSGPCCYGSYV